MRTVGFLISTKENEKRRALLPNDILKVKNKKNLYFETGYGTVLGIDDSEYIKVGANIVSSEKIKTKDIICDPKVGDGNYLDELRENQIIFGWIHAVQNKKITDKLIDKKVTVIAWEDMFDSGRHVFWRNNELAGEAAILHAFTLLGKVPYECKVAVLGKGNIGRGAYKTLCSLGAEVVVYDRKTENLLKKELPNYDVFVNAIMWDIYRKDHIIYKIDLKKMKKNSMIIDISCDRAGAVETSIPTTINSPIYLIDGVLHYVVDHTPSLIANSVSSALSNEVAKYLDDLIEEKDKQNITLSKATIIEKGCIIDKRISDFQGR